MPVHPTLAKVLADWKLHGWEETYGRKPKPDDLIVPTRKLNVRAAAEAHWAFHRDLGLLGLRLRRGHDLRRTFITLAREDGARRDLLEAVTHGPRGDIVSIYTTFPWPALCAEVAKLRVSLVGGEVIQLPLAVSHQADGRGTMLGTVAVLPPDSSTNPDTCVATPTELTLPSLPDSIVSHRPSRLCVTLQGAAAT